MSQRQEAIEAQKELKERQQTHQQQQQEIQEAFRNNQDIDRRNIEQLLTNDGLVRGTEEDLQDATIAKLRSLLSRDVILANLSESQEHDIWYKLQVLKLKIQRMHPPEDSKMTGAARAYFLDDPSERMEPLSQRERVIIDDLITTLQARLTRGRGGFERQQLNTRIAQSETATLDDEDSGGRLRGLF